MGVVWWEWPAVIRTAGAMGDALLIFIVYAWDFFFQVLGGKIIISSSCVCYQFACIVWWTGRSKAHSCLSTSYCYVSVKHHTADMPLSCWVWNSYTWPESPTVRCQGSTVLSELCQSWPNYLLLNGEPTRRKRGNGEGESDLMGLEYRPVF